MRISVVTPSFRQSRWLKLCIASVADQQVDVEHIIQDNCSDDATAEWLTKDSRVKAYIEKDSGMYDAINRGLRKASGDILAYLNCDEQYLPEALPQVVKFFEVHPNIEVLFANVIIVDGNGNYICSRTVNVPDSNLIRVAGLPVFSCATFFRHHLIERGGLFDPSWRAAGDADWVLRLLKQGVKMAVLPRFISTFTDAGQNLGLTATAQREANQIFKEAPKWVQNFRFIPILQHRVRRLLTGAYDRIKPFDYAIYSGDQTDKRTVFHVAHPTFLWKTHLELAQNIGRPSDVAT